MTESPSDQVIVLNKDEGHYNLCVKYGKYEARISLMPLTDHLCIDVYAYVDGERATAGVFGMSEGVRRELPNRNPEAKHQAPRTTSHGWNSDHTIAVLIGEQGEEK